MHSDSRQITFISAGAGSGKTFSLMKKLVKDIRNKKYNANEVLLTTFTKLAAAEIRLKAHTALLNAEEEEQANNLQSAYMGTVHSVGYQFLKRYWYKTGLSPQMKEISEEDVDFFFNQAIANIPEEQELKELNGFREKFGFKKQMGVKPVDDIFRWKSDIKSVINLALSNRIEDLSENSLSLEKSLEYYRKIFQREDREELTNQELQEEIRYILQKVNSLPDNRNKGIKDKAAKVEKLAGGKCAFSDIFDLCKLFDEASKKEALKTDERIESFRTKLNRFFASDWFHEEVKGYIQLVFKLANKCIDQFKAYKKENGLIDFSDMEALFLDLLEDQEVKRDISQNIKMVMVDEFQDSNPIQLGIFLKLSAIVQYNVWVGDPKQAIYGFRGTDPELVNSIYKVIANPKEGAELKSQLLKRSWRSRRDLVELVNKIFGPALKDQLEEILIAKEDILGLEDGQADQDFKQWVKEQFGQNNQTRLSAEETVSLLPVRDDSQKGFDHPALIHWHFDAGSGGRMEKMDNYLAAKVSELLNSQEKMKVYDEKKDCLRDLKPSDVAILCRTNAKVKELAAELRRFGIETKASIPELENTVEYRIVLNILEFLVEPKSSLAITELIALFPESQTKNHASAEESRFPDGKQSNVEELVNQRIKFMAHIRNEEDAGKRAEYLAQWGRGASIIDLAEAFRAESRHLSVFELLEKLIMHFNLYRHLSAYGNALQRRANLQQMLSNAKEYSDQCQKTGQAETISGFMDYIKKNENRKMQAASDSENAVNVLTYHKAKGLEWPVVLLYDLQKQYDQDFWNRIIFKTVATGDLNPETGNGDQTGSLFPDPLHGRYIRFSFWPFSSKKTIMGFDNELKNQDICRREDQKAREEALRLLYVGFTRAKDYLITSTMNDKPTHWLDLATNLQGAGGQNTSFKLSDRVKSLPSTNKHAALFYESPKVRFERIVHEAGQEVEPEERNTGETPAYFDKKGFKPQNDPLFINPSKEKGSESANVTQIKNYRSRIRFSIPEAAVEDSDTGTFLHKVLYRYDDEQLPEKLPAMIQKARMDKVIVKYEDVLQTVSNLKDLISHYRPEAVYRELAMEVINKEGYVLKGEADLVLEKGNDLILIDYKSYAGDPAKITDPNSKEYHAGKYAGQFKTYKEMLEASFPGKTVKECLIYYVAIGLVLKLDL